MSVVDFDFKKCITLLGLYLEIVEELVCSGDLENCADGRVATVRASMSDRPKGSNQMKWDTVLLLYS